MFKINCKVDVDRAVSRLGRIPDQVKEKATVRALNATANQAKIQAAREIRDAGYKIKVGAVKKAISITRASRSDLKAVVRAIGRPIGLINYSPRQVKSGVSVDVKNGRKVIQGAFIATMPNGHQGVFIRAGHGHKKVVKNGRAQWHGLPLKELYGPSIPSAFANDVVQSALVTAIRERFPKNFQREVRFLSLKR